MTITLDRPESRNAMSRGMGEIIAAALDDLDGDPALSLGILTGAGGTFCSGMDLKRFAAGEEATVPGRGFGGVTMRPPAKPLIAAVEGFAVAGGLELVLACDLVVAGVGARLGLPEVRRGLVARGGGILRLARRLPHALAMELVLTGQLISADHALELGLVNRVVADGDAMTAARELAAAVAANAPLAVRASKRILVESRDWSREDEFRCQSAISDPVFVSADAREGAVSFAEKRAPHWQGR